MWEMVLCPWANYSLDEQTLTPVGLYDVQGRCNGNGGESVTIMVSDSCPECEADHLDLQALTYNQVGTHSFDVCCT